MDVPDAPEVSLAGIKADAVTLHWSRPTAHKPVVKYLIQVNGVNGEFESSFTIFFMLANGLVHSWRIFTT